MRFRKSKTQPDEQGFYPTIPVADIAQDQITPLKVANQKILVTKHEGGFFAFSAYCPHAAGELANGQLYKGRIDCPDHGYRFDICQGKIIWPPDESYRLQTYPIKLIDGLLFVKINS